MSFSLVGIVAGIVRTPENECASLAGPASERAPSQVVNNFPLARSSAYIPEKSGPALPCFGGAGQGQLPPVRDGRHDITAIPAASDPG